MKSRAFALFALLVLLVLSLAAPAAGDVPRQINYQGVLKDMTGQPLNGDYNVLFRIYPDSLGSGYLWEERHVHVGVSQGVFHVILGSIDSMPDSLFQSEPRFLGITVDFGGMEIVPRTRITSVPWAMRAAVADSVLPQQVPAHNHDNLYYRETELNSSGTINAPANPVDWTKLKSVPGGFADGIDNTSTGGEGGWVDDGTVIRLETSTDNVGIGTANPQAPLHVSSPGTPQYTTMKVENSTSSNGEASIGFKERIDTPNSEIWVAGVGSWSNASDFVIGRSGPKLLIAPDGNVGIGTSEPAQRLQVAGTIHSTTGGFKFPDGSVQTTAGWLELPYKDSVGAVVPPPVNGLTAFEAVNYHWACYPDPCDYGIGIKGRILRDQVPPYELNVGVWGVLEDSPGVGPVPSSAAVLGTSENGPGVKGLSSSDTGVYAGTESGSEAIYAEVSSGSGTGLVARGGPSGGKAAKFYGNVEIRNASTETLLLELGEGLDYAEGFNVSDEKEIPAGSVLVIDARSPGELCLSSEPYDRRVAGIAAGARGLGSGVRLGAEGHDLDVALAGRVYCNVDATEEGIEPGDLLTTSSTHGYAMKAVDGGRAPGAILGKAMEPMAKGQKGQILVLVTLQ